MQLPGGALINGHIIRDFQFTALTGELELILSEQFARDRHHVDKVTDVLYAALACIGQSKVSRPMIEELSVGDRQFLMRQLACKLNDQTIWISAQCTSCDEMFDVSYKYDELPVKQASDEYPQINIQSSLGDLLVRVPCGRDQLAIADQEDETEALHCLLKNIVRTTTDDRAVNPSELSATDLKRIEQSLESAAPEVATELLSYCPYCQHENRITLDPYQCLSHEPKDLFSDLHHIAIHYHWDEKTILNLPRHRRKLYVSLIDKSRGMSSTVGQFKGGHA
jgi:hypothetical protein